MSNCYWRSDRLGKRTATDVSFHLSGSFIVANGSIVKLAKGNLTAMEMLVVAPAGNLTIENSTGSIRIGTTAYLYGRR